MQGIWLSLGAEHLPHMQRSTASKAAPHVCTTPPVANTARQRLADAFQAQPKPSPSSIMPALRTNRAPSHLHQPCLFTLALCARLAAGNVLQTSPDEPFRWTAPIVILAVVLFLVAGLCEIGGGWLVWQVYAPSSSIALSHSASPV
jgi:hypothetical protein